MGGHPKINKVYPGVVTTAGNITGQSTTQSVNRQRCVAIDVSSCPSDAAQDAAQDGASSKATCAFCNTLP
ncbi:hypothetical protein J1614_005460 [Plenodomus biglobosus]|nr:hypothetical protein J1614_005460 [Plenodomus biglobosus]